MYYGFVVLLDIVVMELIQPEKNKLFSFKVQDWMHNAHVPPARSIAIHTLYTESVSCVYIIMDQPAQLVTVSALSIPKERTSISTCRRSKHNRYAFSILYTSCLKLPATEKPPIKDTPY